MWGLRRLEADAWWVVACWVCGVRELRHVGVVACGVATGGRSMRKLWLVRVALCAACRVWGLRSEGDFCTWGLAELQHLEVAMCGTNGTWELQHMGAAVFTSCGVWKLRYVCSVLGWLCLGVA